MITPAQEVQKEYVNVYWKISVSVVNKKEYSKDIFILYRKIGTER